MRPLRTLLLGTLAAASLSPAAGAQSNMDRLTFYGYLNQAYGVSSASPILGLNRDASGDYRAAALQARYAMTPVDNFVVQAGSRAIGTSPFSPAPGAVSLDWAYFDHRFDNTSLHLGRMPFPFGFLSETRDVGTLMPFYRAPVNFYSESLRSLDGVMVTDNRDLLGGSVETILYGGGTDQRIVAYLPTNTALTLKLRLERLLGVNMIYSTPITGVRLLGSIASSRVLDTAKVQAAPASKNVIVGGGLDATFDRFMARGETRRVKVASNQKSYNYYAQAGVRVLDRLWLNGQADFNSTQNFTPAVADYVGRTNADRALGLMYQFKSNAVFKVEQHFARGGVDAFVAPTAETPYTNYGIASFAVSF